MSPIGNTRKPKKDWVSAARFLFRMLAGGGLAAVIAAFAFPPASSYFRVLVAVGVTCATIGAAGLLLLLILASDHPAWFRDRAAVRPEKRETIVRREGVGSALSNLCGMLTGHIRSKRYARPAEGTWRSECWLCGEPLIRIRHGHWVSIRATEDDLQSVPPPSNTQSTER